MSESVQLGNLGPRVVPADRATRGGKEGGQGFDAELDNLDARRASPEPEAASGKSARREIADDGEDSDGRIGGDAAFLARLFSLDEKPAKEHAAGEALSFKVYKTPAGNDDQHKQDDKADDVAAMAPVVAVASLGQPAARSDTQEPAANGGMLPDGAVASRIGDGGTHIRAKGDAAPAGGKEASATRMADAIEPGGQKQSATDADAESAKDEAGGRRDQGVLAKVKVLDLHTAPAPAISHAQLPSSTVASLARAIHSGMTSGAAATANDKPPAPAAMHTLSIQLKPETLGTVTARLHLSGGNLRVDLQADNADAHHRLKSDSDTIVKSLRALGYDVDRITVQAPPPAQPTTSGHNAAAQGREQSFQQAAGNNANGQGSSHAGGGREHQEGASHHTAERQEQHSSSRGIYI